ncbi:MAG: hypothetical protein U0264_15175 [Candidatus Kapaibacterium sp.]
MHKITKTVLIIVGALLLNSTNALNACPNCKEAFEKGSAGAAIGEGYSLSVLFMISIMVSVLFGFSFRIYYTMRKKELSSTNIVS